MNGLNHIEYVFVMTSTADYPAAGLDLAFKLANAADKPVCLLTFLDPKIPTTRQEASLILSGWCDKAAPSADRGVECFILDCKEDFLDFIVQAEASTVIFQLSENPGFNKVKTFLKVSRELRIPYIFVKPYFKPSNLERILVPVTFLIEDREKGPFANNLGKAFGSEILMLTAKDYGHKARTTTQAIESVLEKNSVSFRELQARKDSSKVELEAVERAESEGAGLVIISASRSYGLDDILFGPKELHCINRADIPVLLINPRADLYVLCG